MKPVPLSSQDTIEFTAFLPFFATQPFTLYSGRVTIMVGEHP